MIKNEPQNIKRIKEVGAELESALGEFEKIDTDEIESERREKLSEIKAQLQSIKEQLDSLS